MFGLGECLLFPVNDFIDYLYGIASLNIISSYRYGKDSSSNGGFTVRNSKS